MFSSYDPFLSGPAEDRGFQNSAYTFIPPYICLSSQIYRLVMIHRRPPIFFPPYAVLGSGDLR